MAAVLEAKWMATENLCLMSCQRFSFLSKYRAIFTGIMKGIMSINNWNKYPKELSVVVNCCGFQSYCIFDFT